MSTWTKIKARNVLAEVFPWAAERVEELTMQAYLRQLRKHGMTYPLPPFFKRAMLLAELQRLSAKSLVETGTYLGDTVWYLRNKLETIVSIEVEPTLAAIATKRFSRYPGIRIISGDSADKLQSVVATIGYPAVFWLDGHYSSGITGMGALECPIWGELRALLGVRYCHSILIDDARLFGKTRDYPPLSEVTDWLEHNYPAHSVAVENDIIYARA